MHFRIMPCCLVSTNVPADEHEVTQRKELAEAAEEALHKLETQLHIAKANLVRANRGLQQLDLVDTSGSVNHAEASRVVKPEQTHETTQQAAKRPTKTQVTPESETERPTKTEVTPESETE